MYLLRTELGAEELDQYGVATMTVFRDKNRVSGVLYEGWTIRCAKPSCGVTNFFQDTKHLPHDVVFNKFRQRGWEVNSGAINTSTEDFCSNCLHKRRDPKKTKVGRAAAAEAFIPQNIQALTASNLNKVIIGTGLIPTTVLELEGRDRRFKITFKNLETIAIGRLTAAERNMLDAFGCGLEASYLKPDFAHKLEKGVVTMEFVTHWYLTLKVEAKVLAFAIPAE